jgi:hypothetical protein
VSVSVSVAIHAESSTVDRLQACQVGYGHIGCRRICSLILAFVQQVAPLIQYGLLLVLFVDASYLLCQIAVTNQVLIVVRLDGAAIVGANQRRRYFGKRLLKRGQIFSENETNKKIVIKIKYI